MPNPPALSRVPNRLPATAPIAALVAAAACWGIGTVITKHVLADVQPLTLLPIQLTASCLFLTAAALARRDLPVWTRQTRRLATLGVLNPGVAYALGLLGLTSITASMSVLLWAAEPVLILLLAAAVLREHLTAPLAAALSLALMGVLLVVYRPGRPAAPSASSSRSPPSPDARSTRSSPAPCCSTTAPCLSSSHSRQPPSSSPSPSPPWCSSPEATRGRSTPSTPEHGVAPPSQESCTTGSRSGSTSPDFATCAPQSPAPS